LKTVGSILKSKRDEKGWEIEEISKFLKIHPKYLKALEEGRYEVFSDPVHIRGFLKNYAEFLELNTSEVLAFFRREYKTDLTKSDLKIPSNSLLSPRFVITPQALLGISIVVLVVSFFSYLTYQYRSFASAPHLEIKNPIEDTAISKDIINVYGNTEKDSELYINGQKVEVSEEGGFATTISLTEGVNSLSFLSVNKLGKETKITRTVVVEDTGLDEVVSLATPEASSSAEIVDKVLLEASVGPNASWIRVEVDGEVKFDGVVLSGVTQIFEGGESVKIRAGNAGSVKLKVNGDDLGVLGNEGEVSEREFGLPR